MTGQEDREAGIPARGRAEGRGKPQSRNEGEGDGDATENDGKGSKPDRANTFRRGARGALPRRGEKGREFCSEN